MPIRLAWQRLHWLLGGSSEKGPSEPGNRPKWPMPRTRLRPTVHGDNVLARVARGCESRSSDRKRSEKLTTINVTVAVYRMFAEARARLGRL